MDLTAAIEAIPRRIQELRRERWGNRGRAAFAAELGLGSSTYNYYERSRIPPADVLARIAEAAGVELRWLLLGEGPKYRVADPGATPTPPADPFADLVADLRDVLTQAPHLAGAARGFLRTLREVNALGQRPPSPPAERPLTPQRLLPVIGRTAAGVAHFWSEVPWTRDPQATEQVVERLLKSATSCGEVLGQGGPAPLLEDDPSLSAETVALVQLAAPDAQGLIEFLDSPLLRRRCPDGVAWRIDGNSMSPRFEDGDLVVTSPRRPAIQDAPCVAHLKGQIGVTCKLFRREGPHVLLIPVNESYKVLRCRASDVQWALAVLWRIRLVR